MRFSYFLSAVSGALLALSFPRFGHPACAWIALVPLLLALSGWRGGPGPLPGQPPLRAFTLGLVAGLVYFVGTVYWTGTVLATFGGMPLGLAIVAMLLLSAYLAIYPAVASLLVGRVVAHWGREGFYVLPVVWVATEYARGVLFGGFPWVPLGNSQVEVLPVAQVASLVGVSGLSALVALVNAAIAFALLDAGRSRLITIGATAALLVATAAWGSWRIAEGSLTRDGTPVRVGLIQGNVAQEDKMSADPQVERRIFTSYIGLTRDAVRRGAQYVIWPESSTPFTFGEDPAGDAALRDLAQEVQVPILFGSEQIVRDPGQPRLYNAAFLLGTDGRTRGVYRKIKLVPFGEFFPFQEWIAFAAPLVRRFVPFSAGDGPVMLPIDGHSTSTAICYEVIFPGLARDAVLAGSELLTTVTNDGWYGTSSAPYQHFEMAAMRAIEQGRYLARAANTGISGVVDPYGRVVAASGIFEQVGLVEEVRLLTRRTVYAAIGDVVPFASVAMTVGLAWLMRGRRYFADRNRRP